jgi:hypothetical protein
MRPVHSKTRRTSCSYLERWFPRGTPSVNDKGKNSDGSIRLNNGRPHTDGFEAHGHGGYITTEDSGNAAKVISAVAESIYVVATTGAFDVII